MMFGMAVHHERKLAAEQVGTQGKKKSAICAMSSQCLEYGHRGQQAMGIRSGLLLIEQSEDVLLGTGLPSIPINAMCGGPSGQGGFGKCRIVPDQFKGTWGPRKIHLRNLMV